MQFAICYRISRYLVMLHKVALQFWNLRCDVVVSFMILHSRGSHFRGVTFIRDVRCIFFSKAGFSWFAYIFKTFRYKVFLRSYSHVTPFIRKFIVCEVLCAWSMKR